MANLCIPSTHLSISHLLSIIDYTSIIFTSIIYLFTYPPFISPFPYSPVHLSSVTYLSITIYLFIHPHHWPLPIHPFIHDLFIHLSIHLSIYPTSLFFHHLSPLTHHSSSPFLLYAHNGIMHSYVFFLKYILFLQ